MGYLIEFALGIGGNLIAAEIIFRHKRWCQHIIRSAAQRIRDPGQSEIKLEEWLAALDEHVGVFASFSHAIGCWVGAPAVAVALKQPIPKKARIKNARTKKKYILDGNLLVSLKGAWLEKVIRDDLALGKEGHLGKVIDLPERVYLELGRERKQRLKVLSFGGLLVMLAEVLAERLLARLS
jgi:hypothetical protein